MCLTFWSNFLTSSIQAKEMLTAMNKSSNFTTHFRSGIEEEIKKTVRN